MTNLTNKKRALKIQDKFVMDWATDFALIQSETNLSRIFSAPFFICLEPFRAYHTKLSI